MERRPRRTLKRKRHSRRDSASKEKKTPISPSRSRRQLTHSAKMRSRQGKTKPTQFTLRRKYIVARPSTSKSRKQKSSVRSLRPSPSMSRNKNRKR